MNQIVDALRAKYRTPGEALKALGLDEALLKGKQPRMGAVARVLRDEVKKRTGLAQDAELADLIALLDALKKSEAGHIEEIDTAISEAEGEAVEEEQAGEEAAGAPPAKQEHIDEFEPDPKPVPKPAPQPAPQAAAKPAPKPAPNPAAPPMQAKPQPKPQPKPEGKPMAAPATAPNASFPAQKEEKAADEGLEDGVVNDDPAARLHSILKGKLSPEEMKDVGELLLELAGGEADDEDPRVEENGLDESEAEEEAEDEDEESAEDQEVEHVNMKMSTKNDDGPKVVKKGSKEGEIQREGAMDAAMVKKLIDANVSAALAKNDAKHAAIRKAYRDVEPFVGKLAMDAASADEVYRTALKMRDVPNADKIHSSALLTVLELLPKAGVSAPAIRRSEAALGQDAKAQEGFNQRFPNLARVLQH